MLVPTNEEFKDIIEIKTEEAFNELLKRSKAIVYFEAEWSGPQRASKHVVFKALKEIGTVTLPVFKVDVSERVLYAEIWLHEQRNVQPGFIYGGWGETVLIEYGNITDFIGYPGKYGYDKTKAKLKSWQTTETNCRSISK
jgi:hypothetical protein